ncbi:phytanoyl-CoA dioxygenase family protein [Flavobacteriaceae bacterium M23B6Z8]
MISEQLISNYHDQGFLLLNSVFTDKEIDALNQELPYLLEDESPRKVKEKNGEIRSYYGVHQVNEMYKQLSCDKRLIDPVRKILESEIYIYQTKINFKKGLKGEWWEWHQDFPYWKIEDGMESPRVLSAMVYLDDVTEFNGPLLMMPGSHKHGIASFDKDIASFENGVSDKDSWTGSDLKYTVNKDLLAKGFRENAIVSATGKAGSVLLFHGNIYHGSNCNMSPIDRKTLIITYNSVENPVKKYENRRPVFLSERNTEPIVVQ